MKLAFILPSLENKGPIIFTKNLIESLREYPLQVEVYYFKERAGISLNVPCHKITIKSMLNLREFDVIHSTMARPDIFVSLFQRMFKNPPIVSMHNFIEEDLGFLYTRLVARIYLFIWKYALKRIPNCIVSSYEMLQYYKKLLGSKNSYSMIPYGIPKLAMKKERCEGVDKVCELKKKFIIIGSCGSLIERKGFSQLINLMSSEKNVAVVIIGEGDERKKLEQLAEELNVRERLILLGYKDNSIDYYSYFDIYAHTSLSEGFGLAMLAALSQGLPVICSRLPIYNSIIPESSVSYFNCNDLNDLIRAFHRIYHRIDEYSKESYALFSRCFDNKVMGEKHYELYKKITSR